MKSFSMFPIYTFLFVFFAFARQDLHGQKYIGGHVGFNQSSEYFSTLSIGIRKEKQLNPKHFLSFDLLGYFPSKGSSWIKLDSHDDMVPDTNVTTRTKITGFQFQFSHRWYFFSFGQGKASLYFSYGLGIDAFHMREILPYYDQHIYHNPFLFTGEPYSYVELELGLSGQAALGSNVPLKNNQDLYAELGTTYSIFSMEVAPLTADRFIIPNFMNLKIGYRFNYK